MNCDCRKGAVAPGCPRHSVLHAVRHPEHVRGWWHRFLIFTERRRNGDDAQATKGKGSSSVGSSHSS